MLKSISKKSKHRQTVSSKSRKCLSNAGAIDSQLGAALRQLRLARGLSQTELGKSLGLSLQQIQKYESGSNRMAASTLYRAAEILGVDVGAFYAGLDTNKTGGTNKPAPVLIVPMLAGAGSTRSREAELADVARKYQTITSTSERDLVRKLIAKLSSAPAQAKSA